jgi:Eukaryotic protein of unknown function (DUF846)
LDDNNNNQQRKKPNSGLQQFTIEQQASTPRTMSHDLHFTVQNGDGTPGEAPRAGELDHLPNTSTGMMDNNAAAGGTTTTTGSDGPSSLEYIQEKLSQSAHPTVVIFHILFKAIALFLYIFGGWFLPSGSNARSGGGHFITLSVVIILMLAFDFWTVKNVTGRLLVGLRWWNKVDNDSTTWIFESAEDRQQQQQPNSHGGSMQPLTNANGKEILPYNKFDRSVFWTVLYATPVAWGVMMFFALIKFQFHWLLIDGMALSMAGANVYGYYRCSREQKDRFQQMMTSGAQQGAMAMMRSNVLSVLTGTSR